MKNTTLFFAVSALAVAGLGGCKKKAPVKSDEAVPVSTAQVQKKDMPVTVESPGTGEPVRTVNVTAQVDGQILKVNFKEGDSVGKDALLFVVDPAPFQERVGKLKADLATDQKQLEFLKSEEARYKKLLDGGAASQEEYETHKTNFAKMLSSIDGDKAQLAAAQLDLDHCRVLAPLSGKTGSLAVHEGAGVKKQDTKLVSINQMAPIYARFSAPEKHLPSVRKAMAKGPLKVMAKEQGPDGKVMEGKLAFIDNAVDPGTGMIMMKAEFPNRDASFWPGEFVDVTLTLATQKDALVVPAAAVQSGQEGTYVFVVRPDGTAEMRKVAVDRNVGDLSVVGQGLSAGETVVTEGQLRLTDGAKVEAKAPAAP